MIYEQIGRIQAHKKFVEDIKQLRKERKHEDKLTFNPFTKLSSKLHNHSQKGEVARRDS